MLNYSTEWELSKCTIFSKIAKILCGTLLPFEGGHLLIKFDAICAPTLISVTRKKSPNVYKSCPKMISLVKL